MRQDYTNSLIAWRTEFYNSYFAPISTEKGNFREVGIQNWLSYLNSFLQFPSEKVVFKGAMTGNFVILESVSYALIPRCRPNSAIFLDRRICSLWFKLGFEIVISLPNLFSKCVLVQSLPLKELQKFSERRRQVQFIPLKQRPLKDLLESYSSSCPWTVHEHYWLLTVSNLATSVRW